MSKQQFNYVKGFLVLCVLFLLVIPIWFPNTTHASSSLQGIAKNTVHVYTTESTSSKALKSYPTGTVLQFREHNSSWYSAVVYLNGKAHNGYILKSQVEEAVANPKSYKGVALKSSTSVYQTASTSSKSWKSYNQGSILQYQTFSDNWYKATVVVNHKPRTGYIHKSHVENAFDSQNDLKGVGLKSPTVVYKTANSSGASWKSYAVGSVLHYKTFSPNWYEATVIVNNKARTGYIHKSHVENALESSQQQSIQGIGLKNPTAVYSSASTGSSALKSYPAGTILQAKTFTSKWYEATVYKNGKARTGYIHTDHLETLLGKQQNLEGLSLKSPTNVYSRASTSAGVLKSYKQHTPLKFTTFSPNWYEATVIVNGKARIGYIHVDHVTSENITKKTTYNYNLNKMVDAQMKVSPKTDLTNGNGWQVATSNQVQYYTHPSNFALGSKGYFQFLILSHYVGVNPSELNQKFLSNSENVGVLTNKGQAFVNGAKKYNVNEIYLIAHAFLETSRGKSELASGISKWTKVNSKCEIQKDKNGNPIVMDISPNKVYNMFGIGAYDDCAVDAGAQRAYDNKWFNVDTAITEGAKFVGGDYINNSQHKQDTLYKMRWNPAYLSNQNNAYHQYATDVGWATKQATRIYDMYEKLSGKHVLMFDVPQFASQSSSSKGSTEWKGTVVKTKTYPSQIFGITNSGNSDLQVRPDPSRANKAISNIKNGTKVEIIGETTGESVNKSTKWYEVKYNNTTGYVHSSYVELLNLLDVTASGLHVREKPNGTSLGNVSKTSMAAVLDKNNQLVRENEWYQVYYNHKGTMKAAWISGGKDGTQYVKVIK